MKLQHENTLIEANYESASTVEEEKEYGFIATSMGDGLAQIFKDFGVDHIIEGGQTMNPSTEDFMNAIENINSLVISGCNAEKYINQESLFRLV